MGNIAMVLVNNPWCDEYVLLAEPDVQAYQGKWVSLDGIDGVWVAQA